MRILLRLPPLIALASLLSGCLFGGGGGDRPPPSTIRPRGGGPITLDLPESAVTRQCRADLDRAGVRYTPLPDQDYGSGCEVIGAIRLDDIGIPVSGLKAMRCPLAETFYGWVRYGVAPAARQVLGSDVVGIVSYGTYACRAIIGGGAASAGRISQHGLANAVDIAAFELADGRRVSVQQGWNSTDPREREFLRVIQKSACRRFVTVLSPDYNAAHYNHLHLDMGGQKFCR